MATKKYLSYDGLTEYDALIKAEAKSYADAVKEDLLNGAGEAYDTLKELGTLIDENIDAIDALEKIASKKQDKLTGQEGQFVGFDSEGNAIAQNIPEVGADEAVEFLLELGMITPASDGTAIYTIDENNILLV